MRGLKFALQLLILHALLLVAPVEAIQFPLHNDFSFPGRSFGIPGNATYDYVVVGGGTAGNAVATRLAKNGSYSVAVVEAGGFYEADNGNLSTVPAYANFFVGADPEDVNPRVDWGIVTEPQAAMHDRRIHIARGKCLGGSSGRHFFFYHHASKDTYARWAEEVGDASYEYNALQPYFARSAHFTPANNVLRASNASYTYEGTAFANRGGPLQVTVPNHANAVASYFLKGLSHVGIPAAADFVSGTLAGATYAMVTLDPKDMTRSSSETSYLRLALAKTVLAVYKDTLAKKILFEGTRASGVLVNTAGRAYTLHATKEVIVSAGAFHSPQLLMVSGVGPPDTLSKYEIDVVAALPGIGQNLQDQLFFGPSHRVNVVTHSALGHDPAFRAAAEATYLAHQTGPLGNGGGDFAAWEKLPEPQRAALSPAARAALASFPPDWPELEYLMFDGYAGDSRNFILGAPRDAYSYATLVAAQAAPLSRGTVSIRSADTADLPVVDPKWLSDPTDRELLLAGFKRAREVLASPAVRSVLVGEEVYPGANVTTDEQILEAIREAAMTVWHPSATCKSKFSQALANYGTL